MTSEERHKIINTLKRHYGVDVVSGKGGFFIRGHGHISLVKARSITGIKPQSKRTKRLKSRGYGDMGWLSRTFGKL